MHDRQCYEWGSLIPVLLLIPQAVSGQDVRAECDAIAQLVAEIPIVSATRQDTLIVDHRMGRTALGCQLRITGSRSAFEGRDSPDERLRTSLASRGWTEDLRYGADGPDGTAFAFVTGSVLCLFQAAWDGGDDADPSYVPHDRYELVVGCMEREPRPNVH
jgi:hypothetical protein